MAIINRGTKEVSEGDFGFSLQLTKQGSEKFDVKATNDSNKYLWTITTKITHNDTGLLCASNTIAPVTVDDDHLIVNVPVECKTTVGVTSTPLPVGEYTVVINLQRKDTAEAAKVVYQVDYFKYKLIVKSTSKDC